MTRLPFTSFLPSAPRVLRRARSFAAIVAGVSSNLARAGAFSRGSVLALLLAFAGCDKVDPLLEIGGTQPVASQRYVIVQAAGDVCIGVWDESSDEVQAWATVDANDLVMVELRADQIEPIIRRGWGNE